MTSRLMVMPQLQGIRIFYINDGNHTQPGFVLTIIICTYITYLLNSFCVPAFHKMALAFSRQVVVYINS